MPISGYSATTRRRRGFGWLSWLTNSAPSPQKKAKVPPPPAPLMPTGLTHLSPSKAHALLASPNTTPQPHPNALLPIRLTLLTRGVAHPCARIYRLPTTDPELRKAWLGLHPSLAPKKPSSSSSSSSSRKQVSAPKPKPQPNPTPSTHDNRRTDAHGSRNREQQRRQSASPS